MRTMHTLSRMILERMFGTLEVKKQLFQTSLNQFYRRTYDHIGSVFHNMCILDSPQKSKIFIRGVVAVRRTWLKLSGTFLKSLVTALPTNVVSIYSV